MKIRLTVLVALGSVMLGTAHAESRFENAPQVVVNYDDLNIDSDRGAKALYVRIQSAATRVCPLTRDRDMAAASRAFACRRQAVERAVQDVNHPRLVAIHTGRTTA